MLPNVITRTPPEGVETHPHPLLFVHGAWHGAWCWNDHFLPWFAERGFEVHALDLRGHGATPADRSLRRVSANHYLEDIHAVVESLDREPILIGHSMGGYLTQRYLETHDLPFAVLVASAPPRGVIGATMAIARSMTFPFIRANLTMSLWPLIEDVDQARHHFFSDALPIADVELHHGRMQDESYRAFLDMLILRLPRPARVKTEVLVLGGSADTIFSIDEVRATARAYGTEAVILDGVAHDMMLDVGWEQAAEAILAGMPARA